MSSELGHSSLMNRTQYGSQQVFTTTSLATNNYLAATDRPNNEEHNNSRSLERRENRDSMKLKSKVASTQLDPGAFEMGKGSIHSHASDGARQDGDKSDYTSELA